VVDTVVLAGRKAWSNLSVKKLNLAIGSGITGMLLEAILAFQELTYYPL